MPYKVRFVDPGKHYRSLKPELDAAILGCLDRGDLVLRDQLRSYERNLADFVGTRFAVGVSSGYHALHLSLVAAGIGKGDEVITVAHTFLASISAIIHAGATPVLVDVGDDYNMDPDLFEAAITPRTKAVMPVHLNGRICDMGRIISLAQQHDLVVIEDAAQALGAAWEEKRAGSFGAAGCFSHYPFKVLGGFGDGGAITTDDPEIARIATLLRFNGQDRESGDFHYHGYTALLDNVQAAALDVKLKYLPSWIERRQQIAARYQGKLSSIPDLSLPHFDDPRFIDIFQNYVIRTPYRDELLKHLESEGIEVLVSWPRPIWEYEGLGLGSLDLPNTESICREVLSLPLNTDMSDDETALVIDAVLRFFT